MYTQGQAIVFININGEVAVLAYYLEDGRIYRYNEERKCWQKSKWNLKNSRAATEAEILEHIQLHGWSKDENQENGEWWSPKTSDFFIGKIDRWSFDIEEQPLITEDNCLQLSKDLDIADRLIKALNLAK